MRWPWWKPKPELLAPAFADMPEDARAAAVAGIKARLDQLDKDIDQDRYDAERHRQKAQEADDTASFHRKHMHAANDAMRQKIAGRDALALTLTGIKANGG